MKTRILFIALLILISAMTLTSGPRRVLLEFSTGTWCGYCPCGDSIIAHHILPTYPQTIVIAYHGGGGGDPFINFNGNGIIALLNINAYPLAVFDRQSGPGLDYDYNWPETTAVRYQRTPNSLIDIMYVSKSYNTNTRQLSATINSTALQNLTGQYKITYVVIENNINYQQNHYASCGTPGYHPAYIHDWVTRNIVNGATGENINTGTWTQNQTIPKTVTTTLDASWIASNCSLIVFVYKDNTPLYAATVEQTTTQSVTNPLGIETWGEVPERFALEQNYPNPFNPVTRFKYSVPRDGDVSLKVYDALGNEVAVFADGFLKAGNYNAEFDASSLGSGIYFYTLSAADFRETRKMILVK
jgi:hypothetical protein